VRIGSDHSCSSPTETRRTVASSRSDNGFAEALASAAETTGTTASDTEASGPAPELSAATYRLFAAVAIDRGDDAHAELFRARAADAREAGLPLHPAGVLSDTGRWDYTEEAAAIPETGHFDSASGQGERTFIPYNTGHVPAPTGCDPAADAAAAATAGDATDAPVVDRLHPRFARGEISASVEALLATLAS
jgi:hypothetical protein